MRALCILREEGNPWVKKYFPHESPYLLHFLGKPLLEYFFDFFELMGVKKVCLSMDDGSGEITERYANGDFDHCHHFSLDYAFHGEESLENILLKNHGFLQQRDVWIFDGFFFLHYDKNHFAKQKTNFLEKFSQCGWMHSQKVDKKRAEISFIPHFSLDAYQKVKKQEEKSKEEKVHRRAFLFSQIKNTPSYYEICMQILQKEKECYALPGYRDIFGDVDDHHCSIVFGKGSEVQSNVQLHPQVQCGDFVTIEKGVHAGPNVILGNDTHVGSGSFLSDSIIYDGVYLGKSLTIKKSILTPTHLLRVDRGEIIRTEDPVFFNQTALRSFKRKEENKIFHQIAAVVTFFLAAPFFSFFVAIFYLSSLFFGKKWVEKRKINVFVDAKMNERAIVHYVCLSRQYFVRLFFAFSLHKFPLLFAVMKRNMGFVGNEPLIATKKNIFEVKKVKNYWASIFSFSSAYGRDDEQNEDTQDFYFVPMVERYFSGYRCMRSYLKTLFFSIKKNFEKYGQVNSK